MGCDPEKCPAAKRLNHEAQGFGNAYKELKEDYKQLETALSNVTGRVYRLESAWNYRVWKWIRDKTFTYRMKRKLKKGTKS